MTSQLFGNDVSLLSTQAVTTFQETTALDRILYQLYALSGEYLFFIGATYLAILLLKHRRWLASTATFALAVLWLTFHLPIALYLETLGVDSFAETQHFDFHEAKFWLQSMGEAIQPDFSTRKFIAYLSIGVLSFYSLRWVFQRRRFSQRAHVLSKLALSVAFITLAFYQTTAKALALYLENTEKFQLTAQNYQHEPPAMQASASPVDLVVYIGESTAAMHMGLYGYPRPTTPKLSAWAEQDQRLVVFDHVFSTHAHTSRSLLEALSFGVDAKQLYLPISDRQRVSVVDVMKKGGHEPLLLSNQAQGGPADQTSSVIFKNAPKVFRGRTLKPDGSAVEPPWDDEFFDKQLQKLDPSPAGHRAIFLHSYAGHGPYQLNIPESFRTPVDDALKSLPLKRITQNAGTSPDFIDGYDAAVRYVDHSVSRVLEHVKRQSRPTIFVYFADHGESVFTGIGHDSARFRHEMARVPFMVYFNEAAVRARPGQLEKYRQLANNRNTATLAQLPATLIDLQGVRFTQSNARTVLTTALMGEATELPPIMVRETSAGITFVNLNGHPSPTVAPTGQRLRDVTDADTRRYVAARRQPALAQQACSQTPETLEEISRSILVLRCPPSSVLMAKQLP